MIKEKRAEDGEGNRSECHYVEWVELLEVRRLDVNCARHSEIKCSSERPEYEGYCS